MAQYYGGARGGGGRRPDGSQERLDSYTATEATEDTFEGGTSVYTNSVYGSQETLDDSRSQASSARPQPQSRRFRPQPQQQQRGGAQQPYADPAAPPPEYDSPDVQRDSQPYSVGSRGRQPTTQPYQARPRSPSPSEFSESRYSESRFSDTGTQYSQSQYSQSQYSQSQYSEQPSARGAARGGGRYAPQQPPRKHQPMTGRSHQYAESSAPSESTQREASHYQSKEEEAGLGVPVGQPRGAAYAYRGPASVSSQDQHSEMATGPRQPYGTASKMTKYSRPHYQQKTSTKPRVKSAIKEPGYYNMNTDTILRTKKTRRGFVLSVAKPYAKNYYQGARDFMPVAVGSLIFNPIVGWVPLAFSLMARKANQMEETEKAAYLGKTAFWTSIVAIVVTIIFIIVVLCVIQDGDEFAPRLH